MIAFLRDKLFLKGYCSCPPISLLPKARRILPWRCNLKGTQYLVSARLVLPKYGGRKSSKREKEDTSAFAEASCLGFINNFAKETYPPHAFGARVLELTHQPMEGKIIISSNLKGSLIFSTNFQQIAAMNPCP